MACVCGGFLSFTLHERFQSPCLLADWRPLNRGWKTGFERHHGFYWKSRKPKTNQLKIYQSSKFENDKSETVCTSKLVGFTSFSIGFLVDLGPVCFFFLGGFFNWKVEKPKAKTNGKILNSLLEHWKASSWRNELKVEKLKAVSQAFGVQKYQIYITKVNT
jgi:hypothetical protein